MTQVLRAPVPGRVCGPNVARLTNYLFPSHYPLNVLISKWNALVFFFQFFFLNPFQPSVYNVVWGLTFANCNIYLYS